MREREFQDFSVNVIGLKKSKVERMNSSVTEIEIFLRTKHGTPIQSSPRMSLGQIWRQQRNNGKTKSRTNRME